MIFPFFSLSGMMSAGAVVQLEHCRRELVGKPQENSLSELKLASDWRT